MKRERIKQLLGAHLSIAKGFEQTISDAIEIGCETFQIFTKSNRQWNAKPLSIKAVEEFKKSLKKTNIKPKNIFVHASYLINLGSSNKEVERKSIQALSEELNRCSLMGLDYLVLHPGSSISQDINKCIKQIAYNINYVLKSNKGNVTILLENMAGQGTSVGYTFEQLGTLHKLIAYKNRVGVCFDTCHAFSSGYDFSTVELYKKMWHSFDTHIGLSQLKLIHMNDSKKGLSSHVDRHEEIGKGKMDIKSFWLILHDKNIVHIPKILETPKSSLQDDKRNLQKLRKLIDMKTYK